MYRLLALDIDGTLVNSRDELTSATRAAIAKAQAAGIHVALATGRRYSRSLHLVDRLELDGPLISASGALIKHPRGHRTLFHAQFRLGLLAELLKLIAAEGFDPVLYTDSFAEGFDFYCPRLEVPFPELTEFYQRNAGVGRAKADLVERPPEGVFALFAMGTQAQMTALGDLLEVRWPGELNIHVLRSPRYTGWMCEVAPAGVSKWSGVQFLAHSAGIAETEICAVGDDVNDIPMIRGAGLGVAMGNALPEVKAAADRIAPWHDSDGLVAVVDWLLEGRS